MPGRHPDDDVLADLAADVLPGDQARAVEAHVLGCDRCAELLEDAERVRGLLLAGDPGPVPDEIWRRIENALAAETTPGRGTPAPDQPSDRVADTAAFQAFVDAPTAPARVVPLPALPPDEVDDADPGWSEDADPLDDPARWTGDRGRRGGRGGATSRRDARDPGPRRRGPLLLAAAAAVAVVAVVGTVRLADRGSNSEASLTAGPAASSSAGDSSRAARAPASAPIVESGRSYRQSTLAADAEALLGAQADGGPAPASAPSKGPSSAAPRNSPVPAPAVPGAGRFQAKSLAADPTADDIRNPARLAACLGALGVSPDRLVAVDLATYDGREAAILLATSADGAGHEVWAVERTCGPGAEGALGYTRLRG